MKNGLLKSVMVIFMGLIVGCASQSKIERTSISSTTPSSKTITEDRQASEPDSSNEHVSKKNHDILEDVLNKFSQNIKEYEKLLKDETEGKDIKTEMIVLLKNMIDNLKNGKKNCNESYRDAETDRMIQIFQDNIKKYEKLLSFYQGKP